jgi:hypothetical protein
MTVMLVVNAKTGAEARLREDGHVDDEEDATSVDAAEAREGREMEELPEELLLVEEDESQAYCCICENRSATLPCQVAKYESYVPTCTECTRSHTQNKYATCDTAR